MDVPSAGKLANALVIKPVSRWGNGPLRLLAISICLAVAGCAAASPSPNTPTPSGRSVDRQGQYQLALDLPQTDWRTSDAITGQATLSLVGSDQIQFSASGSGPILFFFDEVGGSRHVAGGNTPDCHSYTLEAGQTITSPIKKSGGYDPNAEPSDFERWFATDPILHLPAGEWTITAVAGLSAPLCAKNGDVTLRAAVTVHVSA
jgi:hypothetical protein